MLIILQLLATALCATPALIADDLSVYPGVVPALPLAQVESFGSGTSGSAGVPQLTSSLPALGEAFPEVRLSQGLPGATALLLYGSEQASVPLLNYQSTLYAGGVLGSLAIGLDAAGQASDFAQPSGAAAPALAGLQLVLQAVVADPAATGGRAFSAGLRLGFGCGSPAAALLPSAGALVDSAGADAGSVALGDINGDGHTDSVSTRADGLITLSLGDAAGRLTPVAVLGSPLGAIHQVLVLDSDADGRDDVLAVTTGGTSVRLGGDDPLLGVPISQVSPVPLSHAVALHLDADAYPDLVCTSGDNTKRLMRFDGQAGGGVGPGTSIGTALHYSRLAAGDMDGDGQDDLVLLSQAQVPAVGFFRVKVDGSLAPESFAALGGLSAPKDLVVGDIQLDGKDDAVVIGTVPGSSSIVAVVVVSGSAIGLGPDAVVASFEGSVTRAALAQINAGQDLDLILAGQAEVRALIGQAGTQFSVQPPLPARNVLALAAGALTLDDLDDAVLLDAQGQLSLRPAGAGGLTTGAELLPLDATPLALVDLAADGTPELIARDLGGLQIISNPGTPALASATALPIAALLEAVLADVTGDGLPDLLTLEPTSGLFAVGQPRLRVNLGGADFGLPSPLPGLPQARTLAVGDLNGDGLLDVVVAASVSVGVALADGLGGFTVLPTFTSGTTITALALGDVDGDGVLDLGLGSQAPQAVALHRGVGDGSFLPPVTGSVGLGSVSGLALVDVDDDGRADRIVVAAAGLPTPGNLRVEVALGQLGGSFVIASTHATPPLSGQLHVVDLDADSQADLVLAGAGGPLVLLGHGDGDFGRVQPFLGASGAVVVGDADADGDLDLFVGEAAGLFGEDDQQLVLLRHTGG